MINEMEKAKKEKRIDTGFAIISVMLFVWKRRVCFLLKSARTLVYFLDFGVPRY